MMNKILVPTDFSEHANYALKTAEKLALTSGTGIILIHVIQTPRDLKWTDLSQEEKESYPETLENIRLAQENLNKIVGNSHRDLKILGKVVYDLTFNELDRYAEDYNVGLIVIGSHGANGYRELLIGSNAQKIVRTCKTPVLTVKSFEDNVKFETMVFASSFIKESESAFVKVSKLANDLNMKLHLVFINKPNNFETTSTVHARMKQVAALNPGVYEFSIYNDFTDEEGILEFTDSVNANIIAIATHGKRGFRSMFPSLTEHLVNHSNKPVLSLSLFD